MVLWLTVNRECLALTPTGEVSLKRRREIELLLDDMSFYNELKNGIHCLMYLFLSGSQRKLVHFHACDRICWHEISLVARLRNHTSESNSMNTLFSNQQEKWGASNVLVRCTSGVGTDPDLAHFRQETVREPLQKREFDPFCHYKYVGGCYTDP
jgi:hypothetical protein